MLERPRVMTCLPGRSRSAAASAATAITESGRPARSSGLSRTSIQPLSSARTFWPNCGGDLGEALVDRFEPRLAGGVEAGAGADEHRVVAVGDAGLFGAERCAVLPHGFDAREKLGVEEDRIPVL